MNELGNKSGVEDKGRHSKEEMVVGRFYNGKKNRATVGHR